MAATAPSSEPLPRSESVTALMVGGAPPRNRLLDTHDRVLRLIARDADLSECLEVIALALKGLHGGADCLIIALEPDSSSIVTGAATSDRLDTTLVELTAAGMVGETATIEEALCARDMPVRIRHRIDNHAGQAFGSLMILGAPLSDREQVDSEAVDSLKLLTGYAIDSTRRTRALVSANERFAALAKNIPGVVYQRVVRPNGDIRYSYISEAAKDLFGVAPEEILSNPQALFDCHGPDYYATFHDRLLAASRTMQLWDVEATIITRDGTRKFTHAIARPHKEADGIGRLERRDPRPNAD